MTLRLPFFALALAVVGAGCQGSGADVSDVSGVADAGPFEQVSYSVGYQSGQQFLAQDSSFNFDRFAEGFARGVAGDSTELAYAIGVQYGLQVAQDTLGAIDRGIFLAGLRAALNSDSLLVTAEQFQMAQTIVEDSLEIRRLRGQAATNPQAQERLNAIRRNAVTADSFMTAVAGRQGVRRLADGVLYTVQEEGDGASPRPDSRVSVRYRGQFADGTVFDESGDDPATFSMAQVVPGFRLALLDMVEGETRTVFIPPAQAYGLLGQQGPGGQGGIPPNSALQFELTLVEVMDGQQQMQLPPGFGQ